MSSYVLMLQTDPDDRFLTEETLAQIRINIPVEFLERFDELDQFIALHGRPALFLVSDSNSKFTGLEIVKQLKDHGRYKTIPLVILVETPLVDYVSNCYAAGVNTVITKPSSLELTRKKIQTFFDYWIEIAELPVQSVSNVN